MKHKEKYGAVSNLRYIYGDIMRTDRSCTERRRMT